MSAMEIREVLEWLDKYLGGQAIEVPAYQASA
jgi:hypothetical protein